MKKIVLLSFLLFPLLNYAQNSSLPVAKGAERFTGIPKLVRGPYLQVATDTSMVIRWRTDALTNSRVRYGTESGKLDLLANDSLLKIDHEVKLTGLHPSTKYYYSVGSATDTLQYGRDNYFSTFPAPGTEGLYRIGVFGDCGALSINQARTRDQFIKYLNNDEINAWILLGDNAYNDGNDMEYQAKFFTPYRDNLLKKYPVFPSPGNHEYHDAVFGVEYAQTTHNTAYFKNFSMPLNGEGGGIPSHNPAFYSFDLGNIHFISLDSYGIEANKYPFYDTLGPQVKWLKKDLEANRNKGWVIAFWHHPPYSKGTHDSDTDDIMSGARENLLPILDRYEVDLVLCGHSHVYERSKLMRGYYGKSDAFDASKYLLSNSSGLNDGHANAAPYVKTSGSNKGVVYVVSGSSSYVGKSDYGLSHPAMYYSNDSAAGVAILEVQENRLDFKWICADGVIRDQFTMMKNVNKNNEIRIKKGQTVTLKASYVGDYRWNNKQTSRNIVVAPTSTTVFTVHDKYNYLQDTFKVIVTK